MTSIVRGNEKSGSVPGDILDPGKRKCYWQFHDLSPGYRNLISGIRASPIEVESASVRSGNIKDEAAVVSDLGILRGDSQRQQRAAQVPDSHCD